ncbi:MAG: hypothetical protein QXS68_03070 [Candidatus Methanomethylicaceae archaeon]
MDTRLKVKRLKRRLRWVACRLMSGAYLKSPQAMGAAFWCLTFSLFLSILFVYLSNLFILWGIHRGGEHIIILSNDAANILLAAQTLEEVVVDYNTAVFLSRSTALVSILLLFCSSTMFLFLYSFHRREYSE